MFCRFVRPVLTDGCHGDGGEHGRAQQYRGADDGRRRTMAAVAAAHDFRSARFFTRLSFSRGFFCANTSIARHNRRDPPTALPGRSRPRPDVSNRVRVLCPARSVSRLAQRAWRRRRRRWPRTYEKAGQRLTAHSRRRAVRGP